MKLKLAVVIALVTVVMGCATEFPAGTVMYGGITSPYGRIYTAREFYEEYPDAKALAENMEIEDLGRFIKFSANKDVFGGIDFNLAYVPPRLAKQIKKGDIVKVVTGDRVTRGNVVVEINPPGCEWKGGKFVSAQIIYCNGKPSIAILPEQQ